MRARSWLVAVVGGALLLAGCASRATPSGGGATSPGRSCEGAGFELSLVKESGGEASPVLAAQAFNARGAAAGFTVPAGTEWHVASQDEHGASVTGGDVTLHAVQFADQTWAIDSGRRCAVASSDSADQVHAGVPHPRGSYLRLVLPGHSFPADGTPIRGYVEIHNTSGKPIRIADACDGWIGVGLTNSEVTFTALNGAVACADGHLPIGISRRPIAVATTYNECLQGKGSSIPPNPPRCLGPQHTVMPLLPPGHYETKTDVWGVGDAIAPPAPVAITLTRP